ncbi:hypothetical protein J6590_002036 [Homalodisca vitripennis]|nr:hypothetical protein J6590_002036 [Homalodisca vitripennis]
MREGLTRQTGKSHKLTPAAGNNYHGGRWLVSGWYGNPLGRGGGGLHVAARSIIDCPRDLTGVATANCQQCPLLRDILTAGSEYPLVSGPHDPFHSFRQRVSLHHTGSRPGSRARPPLVFFFIRDVHRNVNHFRDTLIREYQFGCDDATWGGLLIPFLSSAAPPRCSPRHPRNWERIRVSAG